MCNHAMRVSCAAFFLLSSVVLGADSPARVAMLTADAGEQDRVDVPVCAEVPPGIQAWRPMRLVEVGGKNSDPVPMQIETSDPPRIWWILKGKTSAGSIRKYALVGGAPAEEEGVTLTLGPRRLDVSIGKARVFSYNHAYVPPPEGVGPEYLRSGYIHPMFSPSGMLLTEDFPRDHRHHKGIWMPWTHTTFEGREIDFWNLGKKQGTVQFAGFESMASGPVYGGFKARHEFLDLTQPSGGKTVLNETWDVRVWAPGGREAGYWIFDLTSTQRCASASPLLLLKYRYGGIGYRGAKEWKNDNYVVLTSEGKTKKDGHATRAKWCAHSGSIDGRWATVVVMSHPSNLRFPEPMRIWPSGGTFFNFVPIQKEDLTLEPGKDYVFRYRFFVYEGKIDREKAEHAWVDFAMPPKTKLAPAS